MLPDGWRAGHLKDLCSFKGGVGFQEKYQGASAGDIPFMKVGDMSLPGNETYINYSRNWISSNQKSEMKVKESPRNSIVFAKVGAALRLNRRRILKFDTVIDNNMMASFPRDNCYYKYLFYLLECFDFSCLVQEGAVPSINQNDLSSLRVTYPLFPEQKKIAAVLSTWDEAIEGTERLLANSRQQKKALMQQLLTGKTRLPGFEGAWRDMRLSDVARLGTGYAAPQDARYFSGKGYDFLRVSDLGAASGRWAPASRDKVTEEAVAEYKMSPVTCGATIFTKSGASLLLNQRAQLKEEKLIVSHLGYAKAKNVCEDDFLYYVFLGIDFSKIATGTSLPALKISDLGRELIQLPPLPEQKAIVAVLTAADDEIAVLEKDLARLRAEKKALMQQLLTGKRRVKVA